jgi:hypothetical protein
MTRNAQAQPKWLSGAIIAFLAMLLFAPSAVWAGSRDYDYDHHRTSDGYWSQYDDARHWHASHKRHHHASHKRHHKASHKHWKHAKRRGHHKHHKHYIDYYCRPCDRYFSARTGLYDHVNARHRVPYRKLEIAVDFGEFGWIFFGG